MVPPSPPSPPSPPPPLLLLLCIPHILPPFHMLMLYNHFSSRIGVAAAAAETLFTANTVCVSKNASILLLFLTVGHM